MAAKQVEIGIKIKADGKEFAGVAQLSRKELDQLNRSAKNTNKNFANMAKNAISLKGAIAGLGVALGGIASVGALKSTINDIDQIGKLSERIGISTEALSELSHAADLSGVRFETLTMGLQRMGRRIGEVAALGKGEAKQAFDQLGLSAEELSKMPLDQAFETLADRLSQVSNEFEQTALTAKIFDSEGVALKQIWGVDGVEAIRAAREELRLFGGVITQEMANAAAEANDNIYRLGRNFSIFGQTLATEVIPIVNDVAEALLDLMNLRPEKIRVLDGIKDTFKELQEIEEKLRGGGLSPFTENRLTKQYADLLGEFEALKYHAELVGISQKELDKAMGLAAETTQKLADKTKGLSDKTKDLSDSNKESLRSITSLKEQFILIGPPVDEYYKSIERIANEEIQSTASLKQQNADLQKQVDLFGASAVEIHQYERALQVAEQTQAGFSQEVVETNARLLDENFALQQTLEQMERDAANQDIFGGLFGDLGDEIGKIDLRLDEAFSGWILGTKSFSDAIVDIWAQMFGQILNLAVKFITDRVITQLFSGAGWISSLAAAIGIAVYGVLKSGPASASRPSPSRTTTSGDPRAPGFDAIVTGDVLARDQVFLLDSQTATNLNIQLSIAADQLSMFSGQIKDFALNLFDLQGVWNSVSLGFIDTLADISPTLASFFSSGTGPLEIAMADGGIAVLDTGSTSSAGSALGQIGAVASVLGAAYTIYSLVDSWDDMTGIQKAMGSLSAVSSVLTAVGAIANIAGAALQAIPIIGWVVAAIVQILDSIQSFQSGNWVSGVSKIFGGHLGGLLADKLFPPDAPDAIFRTSNDTISEVPKGTATTLNGGIGVESLLGATTVAVRNVDISDQQVLDMFGPILEAIAQVDNELARSLNRMDQGLTLDLFKEALGNIAETSVETVQDLEDLEVADFIRERYHQIFNLLGQTGTELGVAMDEWFDVLDGVFGAEFTLGVVAILASSIEDLMTIPNELVHFLDDRLKSGKVGGTPEDALREVEDVLLSFELLTQGFNGLGASIDDTTIIQFLANMTEIGFATKDAAIGVLAYATALKGANQNLQGEELGQAIVQGVQDLIDYANSMQLTNAQLSALIGTFAQFAGVFNELGLDYTMDDLFVLSEQVDALARESQDAALEVEGASQAIQDFGIATGEALAKILNETLFFARWIETAGGAASQVGVSGLEFVEAARGFVAGFDNMEAATSAFSDYLTTFFSDAEIARMQQQWANDALNNFVQANTQFSGIDPRNIPSELWIDPLIKSFLELSAAAQKANDAVQDLSDTSRGVGADNRGQNIFWTWFTENVTGQLGSNALSTEDQLNALNAEMEALHQQAIDLAIAAGLVADQFGTLVDSGGILPMISDAIEALKEQRTNEILGPGDVGNTEELNAAINEFYEMAEQIGKSDFELQLMQINKEFGEWADRARDLIPAGQDLTNALGEIARVQQLVIDDLLATREKARQEMLGRVGDQFFIETASEFQGQLAQMALGFLDTIQQMADLGGEMEDFNTIMDIAMRTGTKRLTDFMQQVRDEFDAIFDRIEGASRGIQKNIDQLLGVGIEQQLADAYARLNGAEGVDEQIAIIQEIQSLIMQRYQDEVSAIQSVSAAVTDFQELVDSWKVDENLSPLSNEARLAEARSQYSTLLSAAQAGDADAISRLGGAATEYLNEARSFFASSKDYAQIFEAVTGALSAMGVVTTGGEAGDIQDETLAAQHESVAELRALQDRLDGLMSQQQDLLQEELDTAHQEAIFIAEEFNRRAQQIIAGSKSDAAVIASSISSTVQASSSGVEGAIGEFAGANIQRLDAINQNLVELGIDPLSPATLTDIRTILGEMKPLMFLWYGKQQEWFLHNQNWFGHLHNQVQILTDVTRITNETLRDIYRQMGGAYAAGGIVYEDSWNRLAEGNNPEAVVPLQSGAIPVMLRGPAPIPSVVSSGGDSKEVVEELRLLREEVQLFTNLTAENTEQLEKIQEQSKRQADAQKKIAEESALQ